MHRSKRVFNLQKAFKKKEPTKTKEQETKIQKKEKKN
jgi:hypothetical protein